MRTGCTKPASNALNHVDEIRIVDIRIEERDDKIRISVFNTGEPIPEEDIEHIWEKFYKVDKARTREYGGNGIGLSIVKAIMESFHQNYGVKKLKTEYSSGLNLTKVKMRACPHFLFSFEGCVKLRKIRSG